MYDEDEMSAEMRAKRWSPGYLYILDYGDGEVFKIGITSGNPELRSNQVTRNVGALVPNPAKTKLLVALQMDTNPYYLEQLLHMKYAGSHEVGEWFKLPIHDLVDLVAHILPFGHIEYYDGWFGLFDDDYIGYVVNAVYPSNLEYRRGISQYTHSGSWVIVPAKGRSAEAVSIKSSFDSAATLYPGSFSGITVGVREHTVGEDLEVFTQS